MKHNLNDPIHNPFHNRFHVPVHSRLDEMQAHKHVIWLKDPSRRARPVESRTGYSSRGKPYVNGRNNSAPDAYAAKARFRRSAEEVEAVSV
jgi:hypothetical protein